MPADDMTLPTPPRSSQDVGPSSSIPSSPTRPAKRRAKPTITPRTFRRFFTPRNALGLTAARPRDVLTNLSLGDVNARNAEYNRPSGATKRQLFDEDENPSRGSNTLRDIDLDYITPRSSPIGSPGPGLDRSLKRKRGAPPLAPPTYPRTPTVSRSANVERSSYRSSLGALLRREMGFARESHERLDGHLEHAWQSHVADFYTGPADIHICRHPFDDGGSYSAPFSLASCHTNSLVAVGDEAGYIRLLDTEKNGKSQMRHPHLAFRAHDNAILDLEFSGDDFFLATASGDQKSSIIDMRTQQVIYSLRGHASSAKQVRFQPGSGHNVIATSSRDGSIMIWDLRCKATSEPRPALQLHLGGSDPTSQDPHHRQPEKLAACVGTVNQAHLDISASNRIASVTALSFLDSSRSHLLLSGSEANSTVKLWDLRAKQKAGGRKWLPLGATRQPEAHGQHRHFGLTSMALSGDSSRLYTLCKDNTVYAYSINHLLLGTVPEMDPSSNWRKRSEAKEGLGPLYAFQHPKLKVSSFYIKTALRPCRSGNAEVLAAGSNDSCAVLFPTNERSLFPHPKVGRERVGHANPLTPIRTPTLCTSILSDESESRERLQISRNGTALVRGHDNEVTGLAWAPEGELVTISDDFQCRVWREDADQAHELRTCGESGGKRWQHGWADIRAEDPYWDEDE